MELNVSKDLEIIKELEKKIGIKLEQSNIDEITGTTNGYAIDENENIIGMNLWLSKISNISSLKDLRNLTHLYLHTNRISDISSLKDLRNLTCLDLHDNQISDISSLTDLKNLTHLYLHNNRISDISPLKDLKNVDLNLTNNKISELPVEVANWKGNLVHIFGRNPIEIPPMEIMKKGKEAIKAYFESLEGEKRVLNEVKMLLVGDGGAGKTSLVKQLIGEKFDKNEPQTHGINIKNLEVKTEKDNIRVNIWDFGGQEIMHATHQFFLSKRSLYVLVLDGRKDEKTEYWLKHVKSFGGDSPVLVVINKIDENPGFDVNRLFLQEKYKNIKGFFRVSCASGEGIEKFSQELIKELAKVELIHTTWAETWFKVKTKLEKMNEDFISYDEYKTLCKKKKVIRKISQDTLVDFLHDLGVVLHFKDFKLQETHVINPEWVTTAVYKIINSKDLAESKGLLKLNRLDKILKREKDTDYYYPRDKYRYIIDLMQKFELCYEIDSETILIPDLLEIQEPSFDFDYANALKFQIQYDFLPMSIMPRFMVKMHKAIKTGWQWRTGFVLEDEAFDCIGVVKSDDEEKRIYIYVRGEQKRDYFAAILFTLREINNSFEKMEAVEKVPMPDEPNVTVSYKHLIRLEQRGREYYEPDGSEKEYNVKDLLGTVYVEKKSEDEVLQILKDLKEKSDNEETLLQKATNSILLQPNIMGFGINLNNLIKKLFDKDKKKGNR
jgi:small GTP-binding protein